MLGNYWMPAEAAIPYLAALIGPRADAVAVSVAYVIRLTIEVSGVIPPANHPSVVLPVAAK
jgi:hypothetical protein